MRAASARASPFAVVAACGPRNPVPPPSEFARRPDARSCAIAHPPRRDYVRPVSRHSEARRAAASRDRSVSGRWLRGSAAILCRGDGGTSSEARAMPAQVAPPPGCCRGALCRSDGASAAHPVDVESAGSLELVLDGVVTDAVYEGRPPRTERHDRILLREFHPAEDRRPPGALAAREASRPARSCGSASPGRRARGTNGARVPNEARAVVAPRKGNDRLKRRVTAGPQAAASLTRGFRNPRTVARWVIVAVGPSRRRRQGSLGAARCR
jgi:hypothetical protein